jgi:D-sedoheptulose 7-phosphate isomerase
VLLALSTSGGSRNVIEAARAAERIGVTTWALTGPGPNLLAAACQETVTINTGRTSTVQEMHLAVIHMICAVVDHCVQADAAREAEQRDLRVVHT